MRLALLITYWTVAVLIVVFLVSIGWTHFVGAPWVPTPRKRARRMLDLAALRPGETLYDLGSGDGRILIDAARQYHAHAVGIEIDPLRILISRTLIAMRGLTKTVRVIWGKFQSVDLSDANVVTLYLLPETNKKLAAKLRSELKPGTRVVSHSFTLPDWDLAGQDSQEQLYLYRA